MHHIINDLAHATGLEPIIEPRPTDAVDAADLWYGGRRAEVEVLVALHGAAAYAAHGKSIMVDGCRYDFTTAIEAVRAALTTGESETHVRVAIDDLRELLEHTPLVSMRERYRYVLDPR